MSTLPLLLLVHSPLVGPSSWTRLATSAADRGIETIVPDLTGVAESPPPRWSTFVDLACDAVSPLDRVVIVGHSGAGTMLPVIADRLNDRVSALIFVDAVVPPAEGVHQTPTGLQAMLDEQTTEGQLTPWLEWWPTDVIETLLPSAADRETLAADMPSLARDFYDDAIPMPDSWTGWSCAYLQLSEAYDDDRERATRFGWPSVVLDSSHLGIFTSPTETLDALLTLVSATAGSRSESGAG